MNIVIFDNQHNKGMLPLTFTRPQADIRCGILTIKEKWEKYLNASASYLCSKTLSIKFQSVLADDNIFINASVLPTKELASAVGKLGIGSSLIKDGEVLAVRGDNSIADKLLVNDFSSDEALEYAGELDFLSKVHQLISYNKNEIAKDYALLTKGRTTHALDETVTIVGANKDPQIAKQIFVEEGAEVEYCYLNPKDGPIYIGKNAKVHEGAMLRGPIAVCESAQISMGAKIHQGASIGPWSKVGGEVSNSVITGYCNKVHDGYLGDSILGEWCNLGADTNTSNLKNDFALVKLWDYNSERFAKTGLQFCGLVMGDYSRCAINTSFNSGTVVGVGSNIFGSGFPRNFIPSFVIGGPQGFKVNRLKAVENTAKMAMARRNVELTEDDTSVLSDVFELTKKYRSSFR
ncbi:putative sugar nucleotidyl transferase [Carboxylicivirga sp. M1479]|uniref:putative sugar nucleotidyl transferase n=1 Tax=Carboxylicivirga sp. M1479 TaxID=2594476 RepID=UPI00117857E2|nr:putative sugar nucleotidyl transferase [Carboxylicivirga sp. M1479]TRX71070.1 glucose-1-phosphate thymidylyltransferase [Carboxylicivirga sp. M1479]